MDLDNSSVNSWKLDPFKMNWPEVLTLVSGFVGGQFLAGIFALFMGFFQENFQKSAGFMPMAYFFTMFVPIFIFYIIFLQPKAQKFDFTQGKSSVYKGFLSLVMMLGMMLVSEFVVSLLPIEGEYWGAWYESFSQVMEDMGESTLAMVLTTVIMAPLLEEILFRGIILKGMLNMKMNPKKAIVISALVFGLIHGYPWQATGAFLLGLVLGWVYYKTQSLLIPILLHAFNNGVAALMIDQYNVEDFSGLFQVSQYITLAIGMVLLIGSAILFNNIKSEN